MKSLKDAYISRIKKYQARSSKLFETLKVKKNEGTVYQGVRNLWGKKASINITYS